MEVKLSKLISQQCARLPERRPFLGAADARAIINGDGAALTRLWTGDHSRAQATKSPTAQAQFLRAFRGKYSRAGHRQRQVAANLRTFITGVRSFIKTYAILWEKFYACPSEHTFDQGNRSPSFPRSDPPRY